MVVVGGLLGAFAVGYLVGDRFGSTGFASGKGTLSLDAKGTPAVGSAPTLLGEVDTRPLASNCFVVALYPDAAEADAVAKAKALAAHLQGAGIKKAKPYFFQFDRRSVWGVAVYFDGQKDQQATREALVKLPESTPDASFVSWRADRQKDGKEWPWTWAVR